MPRLLTEAPTGMDAAAAWSVPEPALHLTIPATLLPTAPPVTASVRDSWFLRMTLPRLERELARRNQPAPEARPVEEARPAEAQTHASSPDPADPNSRGCQGPYTRVITYTRAEFKTLMDPVTDSTPVL